MSIKSSTERHKRWRSATNKRRVDLWIETDLYDVLIDQAKAADKPLAEWIRDLLAQVTTRLPVNAQGVDGKHLDPLTVNTPTHLPSVVGKGARQGEAERRAILAQRALALREEGLSWRKIAERWNAEQVPTLRGGRWDPSTVQTMVIRADKQPPTG